MRILKLIKLIWVIVYGRKISRAELDRIAKNLEQVDMNVEDTI